MPLTTPFSHTIWHSFSLQGILLSVPSTFSDPKLLKRLWVHEVMRVYYDRLVDDSDREWLFKYLKETTQEHFDIKFDVLFEALDVNKDGLVEEDDLRSLMFCDFVDPKNDQRPYVEVGKVDKLRLVVENYLDEFNNISKKPMNLVMFRWAYIWNTNFAKASHSWHNCDENFVLTDH